MAGIELGAGVGKRGRRSWARGLCFAGGTDRVVWCSISSSPTAAAERMQRRRGGRLI